MNRPKEASRNPTPPRRTHLWDKPENVNWLVRIFYAVCVGLVVADFFVHRHVAHPWERFFGFHAFYGFVACWTLVVVARGMRKLLMRDEDYYDVD